MTGGAATAVEADSSTQTQAQKLQQVSQSLPQANTTTQTPEPQTISPSTPPEQAKPLTAIQTEYQGKIEGYNKLLEQYNQQKTAIEKQKAIDELAVSRFESVTDPRTLRESATAQNTFRQLVSARNNDINQLNALIPPTPPKDILGNPVLDVNVPFAIKKEDVVDWELPYGALNPLSGSPYAPGFTYPKQYLQTITYSDLTQKTSIDPNPPSDLIYAATAEARKPATERLNSNNLPTGQAALFNQGYGLVTIREPDYSQFGGSTASGPSGLALSADVALQQIAKYGLGSKEANMALASQQLAINLELGKTNNVIYSPGIEAQVAEAKQNALRPKNTYGGISFSSSSPSPNLFDPSVVAQQQKENQAEISSKLANQKLQASPNYSPPESANPLVYSQEQSDTILNAIKTNQEYGGNQKFLVGNLGTENSTGSLDALNITQSRNTNHPLVNSSSELSHPLAKSDLSTLGPSETNQFVLSGKHVLPAGLVFVPSNEDIARANLAREQVFQMQEQQVKNRQINAGIDNLVAYDKSIEDLINVAKVNSAGGNLNIFETDVDSASIFPIHENKTSPLTFGLLNVNPETTKLIGSISTKSPNAKNQLEDILSKNQGKEITVEYQPAESVNTIGATLDFVLPNEKTQLGQKIDWNNPNSLKMATTLQQIGLPLSAIPEAISATAFGFVGLLESLPTTSHTIANIISKGGYNIKTVKEAAQNLYTPEALQFIESGKINPNESPTLFGGITTALTKKDLSGFSGGYGLASDVVALGTDTFLTLFGLQEAIPLRYTKAIAKASEGLTKDVSLGSALTVGYKEGGSSRILIYKSPEGKISFGTPEPSKYLPEQLPISMSGRGFTRSEGGGLLNTLLNNDQALAYQQSKNILTAQDVKLIKVARDVTPLITKAPVTVFHSTFGPQPLETVLTGSETTALKDVIKTGQSKLGLGSQYGSFADIPFVPGKVNVGDLDLAVSSPEQQNLVGSYAQDMLNKATGNKVPLIASSAVSKTPNTPLDLVIDNQLFGVNTMKVGEPQRLFKYEEGGVFLYRSGIPGKTKIIDLPIKGLNEEGGIMENFHQVFGVEEPTKTYTIEGIETKTPHYNTIRRLTTITRQGNKGMKSAIPGFGFTTKYGDYTGMEIGRMKDAARAYRGITLAAQEYKKIGKTKEFHELEHGANVIKRRFQHVYNFKEALNEIRGETVINKLPESSRLEKSFIHKAELPFVTKEPVLIRETYTPEEKRNSFINSSFKKSEARLEPSLAKSSSLKYDLKSTILKEKSISSKSISRSSNESIKHIHSSVPSITNKSKSVASKPIISKSVINSSVEKSLTPTSKSPSIPSTNPKGFGGLKPLTGFPGKPTSTKTGRTTTNDIIKNIVKGQNPKEILLPNLKTKPDEKQILKEGNRFNYIGNAPESQIVGLYNRQETIYGNKTINKLRHSDFTKTTKGYPKLGTSKSVKGLTSKTTNLSGNKQKKTKMPKF